MNYMIVCSLFLSVVFIVPLMSDDGTDACMQAYKFGLDEGRRRGYVRLITDAFAQGEQDALNRLPKKESMKWAMPMQEDHIDYEYFNIDIEGFRAGDSYCGGFDHNTCANNCTTGLDQGLKEEYLKAIHYFKHYDEGYAAGLAQVGE